MILHCVSNAATGGENRLLDHEIAYLQLRDADPAFVAALMQPDAMTIPARTDDAGVVRAAETGPVFSVDPDGGALHMRYTARTRSIEWKDDKAVREAVACLERILAGPSRLHPPRDAATGHGAALQQRAARPVGLHRRSLAAAPHLSRAVLRPHPGRHGMTQWLTLSRAARLIGVPRGELQREIREGRLAANDGMVSTAGLLALYPQLNLEESGAFERVARLKEEAFGRRVFERTLPGREVLAQRLFAQSQELADTRRHLSRYHDLVVAMQQRIDDAADAAPEHRAARAACLSRKRARRRARHRNRRPHCHHG